MHLVVFGLTVTSSWGNGHATLWRSLCRALGRRGHRVTFFERDAAWYAQARDTVEVQGLDVVVYPDWSSVQAAARRALAGADVGMVTSYCADGAVASQLVLSSALLARVFYDLDTPVTLASLDAGTRPAYLPAAGLGDFDLVLSFTGGEALRRLRTELGARRVAPLYGSVDPELHRPVAPHGQARADLSYLGTYAADRQRALETLFVAPARALPRHRFALAGAQYPDDFPWTANMHFLRHLPPADHPAFFAASRLTLNVTRQAMAALGWCPSGRLFEAACCGTPILSDRWEGLEHFYQPGAEIMVAETTEEAINAVMMGDAALGHMAARARERTLAEHSGDRRAAELEAALETIRAPVAALGA
jgi:spore maturation protein CgeB